MEISALTDGILQGDLRCIAKAITLIESRNEEDRKLAMELQERLFVKAKRSMADGGNSIRIGISGPPGVGKSTFIESFGLKLLENPNTRIAVLTVDPSSPISHGSILGDKTRMQNLATHERCFIRPSPSQGYLGGVTRRTREVLNLFELAGFEWILVESVGVGQSEYVLASMVDLFLMLQLPNSGDELQAIKKGILELVDIILVNKSDGEQKNLAMQSKVFFQNALHLNQSTKRKNEDEESFFETQVFCVSSLEKNGLGELCLFLEPYLKSKDFKKLRQSRRRKESKAWFIEEVENQTREIFLEKFLKNQKEWHEFTTNIETQSVAPNIAAAELLSLVSFSIHP